MFTEMSQPGTNVAAATRLVLNDSHQNWPSSQLIEASICVVFCILMNLCPFLSTLPPRPRPPTITHSQTHAFINTEAGRGHVALETAFCADPRKSSGQRERTQRDGGSLHLWTVRSGGWRMDGGGRMEGSSQFALRVSLFFPPLQPHAGRHSLRSSCVVQNSESFPNNRH